MVAMVVSWLVQQGIYTAFLGMGFVLAYIPLYWHVEGEFHLPLRCTRG